MSTPSSCERRAQRRLEVLGPGRVALPRVGDRGERPADVLGPGRVDAGRHLAEAVVVVPHVQVADGYAAAAQLVGDEVHGEELAQVAEVDRARRADARRAGDHAGPRRPACRMASSAARVTQSWGSPCCPPRAMGAPARGWGSEPKRYRSAARAGNRRPHRRTWRHTGQGAGSVLADPAPCPASWPHDLIPRGGSCGRSGVFVLNSARPVGY